MTRAELKSMAKTQIKGKIGILFVITLIVGLITSAVAAVPLFGAIADFVIITPAFTLGLITIYLSMARSPMYTPKISDVFEGFKNFLPTFKVIFLVGLYTFLWSLLFIIPGIVKAFSYSQAVYIIAENPNMKANDAIRLSQQMMDGHKAEYFILNLSFIGWAYLGALTLGILYIWLVPYMTATFTNYYLYLKYGNPAQAYSQPDFSQPNYTEPQTPQ